MSYDLSIEGIEKIEKDLQKIDDFLVHGKKLISNALSSSALVVADNWRQVAYGGRVPGMTRGIYWPEYASSIRISPPTVFQGISGEIVVSADSNLHNRVTSNRKGWDMAEKFLKGKPYKVVMIIPHPKSTAAAKILATRGFYHVDVDAWRQRLLTSSGNERDMFNSGVIGAKFPKGKRTAMPQFVTISANNRKPGSWMYPDLPANPVTGGVWQVSEEDVNAIFLAMEEILDNEISKLF